MNDMPQGLKSCANPAIAARRTAPGVTSSAGILINRYRTNVSVSLPAVGSTFLALAT